MTSVMKTAILSQPGFTKDIWENMVQTLEMWPISINRFYLIGHPYNSLIPV